jgi:hypothetical protein
VLPKRRLVIRDLARIESRNFSIRTAILGINHPFPESRRIPAPTEPSESGDDGAVSAQSDWEWFIPVSDPAERFASKQRIRAGLTYRHDVAWRFAALYI